MSCSRSWQNRYPTRNESPNNETEQAPTTPLKVATSDRLSPSRASHHCPAAAKAASTPHMIISGARAGALHLNGLFKAQFYLSNRMLRSLSEEPESRNVTFLAQGCDVCRSLAAH